MAGVALYWLPGWPDRPPTMPAAPFLLAQLSAAAPASAACLPATVPANIRRNLLA